MAAMSDMWQQNKVENLAHEQRRHWDGWEFDEYIAFTEGVGTYSETPGAVAYFVRDGELHSPNPLCTPRSTTPALRLSCSTEPDISPPKGGTSGTLVTEMLGGPQTETVKEVYLMAIFHCPISIIQRSKDRRL